MNGLGDYIRRRRETLHMTPTELARALDRDNSYVSRVETGRNKTLPDPAEMARIARALGVTMRDLLAAAGYLIDEDDEAGYPPDVAEIADIAAALPADLRAALRLYVEGFAHMAPRAPWPVSAPSVRSLE